MSFTPISLAIAMFSVGAIVLTLRSIGRDKIGIRSGLIWVGLWLAIAAVALVPDTLDILLAASGMQNRVLFAMLAAILVLFAVLFAQSTRIQAMERDIARLTRHLALTRFRQEAEWGTERDARTPSPDAPSGSDHRPSEPSR